TDDQLGLCPQRRQRCVPGVEQPVQHAERAPPGVLKPAQRTSYAALLRYAAQAGQRTGIELGDLPLGYAPLNGTMRARTLAAAKQLATYKGGAADGGPTTSGTGGGNGGGAGTTAGGAGTGSGSGTGAGAGTTAPSAAGSPGPHGSIAPNLISTAAGLTPADPAVPLRLALPIGAGLGALQGRLAEAMPLFERAVAAHTAATGKGSAVFELFQLGAVQMDLGDPRGRETGRQAVASAEAQGERWARAHALWTLSCHAWRQGERAEALGLIQAALEIERGFNEPLSAALMLETLAWICASYGEYQRAGRILGSTRKLWRDVGVNISAFGPPLDDDHARCEELVVQALGREGYERALAVGGGRDNPRQAIDFALGGGIDPAPVAAAIPSPLTRREREVAALVAKGLSNRKIAEELLVSPRTVDFHVENIRAKLGFSGRAQVAAWWATQAPPTQ
ncbi:helix-turn-helix transcriptional regulator, partial [Streptomyces sp. NPDC005921]